MKIRLGACKRKVRRKTIPAQFGYLDMKVCLILLLMTGFFASSEIYLSSLRWKKRVLLVHIPPNSPEWKQQQVLWQAYASELEERDLVIGKISDERVEWADFQEDAQVYLEQFSIPESSFMVILIGKDGTEKLRSREVLPIEILFGTIDRMPMRRMEMQERKRK